MTQKHIFGIMESWSSEIDEITAEFNRLFNSLNSDELNWKSHATTWSIAQNIDHLIVINRSYFPILAELRDDRYKAPFLARFRLIVAFLGNMILRSVQPDRRKKMKTFPQWEPATSQLPAEIVEEFAHHQEELKREIKLSGELLKAGAIIHSPANRHIVYSLETAFTIIVVHERRHLEQAKEVLHELQKGAIPTASYLHD